MNALSSYSQALHFLLPEGLLVVSILIAALWNLFFPKMKEWTPVWSFLGLGSAFCLLLWQFTKPGSVLFNGVYTVDALTLTFGLIATLVGMIVVLMTMGYEHHFGRNRGEFYAILLTATLSVMLLAGSTDLIMLFVALETLSICCVMLSGMSKRDAKSSEASLKYLLSTAAVTATLLYGLSFLYGLTGSTTYSVITDKLSLIQLPPYSLIKVFILVLVLSAVGFKLSIVPFHMWTPDVYEGAPTPVTAFLSIGSKAGGFVVALRLLMTVFYKDAADWTLIISVMAIVSMIGGNLMALSQTSFKRMLAYSSIAHVGYMMIGMVAANQNGLASMIFYIIIYGLMNLGAFAGAILFSNETGSDNIADFDGYIRKRPWKALLLTVCLLNLAGLPIPPAGFFAKFLIFGAGLQINTMVGNTGLTWGWLLVGVALVTSVPAVFYYTRVAIKMIVKDESKVVAALPDEPAYLDSPQFPTFAALTISVISMTLLGTFYVGPLMSMTHDSVEPLMGNMHTSHGLPLPMSSLPGRNYQ
jgi:NAD(P)H-quinone oxidoreductase subunit 2